MGQAVGTKALQSLGQGGQVAAGIIPRGGKRGQCQNQQKNQGIPHPVPFAGRLCRSSRRRSFRLVRQSLRRQHIRRDRPAVFLPACPRRLRQTGCSTTDHVQQPEGRCIRVRPQNAAPPAHGPVLPEWARLSRGRSWRSVFPGSLRPHNSKPQNRTPFLHPAPFPAGLPAECLRPHHSIPAACGAFPAPAPLHEQGSSPLLHRALPQSGRSGPCGPFPARQAFRPAGPQAPPPHGHGIGLQCLPAVLPAAPSTAVRQTDAAHRWSAFFLRVSTASPPRPGAARINP